MRFRRAAIPEGMILNSRIQNNRAADLIISHYVSKEMIDRNGQMRLFGDAINNGKMNSSEAHTF
jgi:hypothetical protein